MLSAILFAWLQGAGFYRQLHGYAHSRIPSDVSGSWLEVGCGPGLLTRLAAERGFRATGVDANRVSVWLARLLAFRLGSRSRFEVGRLETITDHSAGVVAASSLLAVLPDEQAGLQNLWDLVEVGGCLLVVEPTARLTAANVDALIARGVLPARRLQGLEIWVRAREGRTVTRSVFEPLRPCLEDYRETLGGMVGIWIFRKSAPSSDSMHL